jgi:hypothetical protein
MTLYRRPRLITAASAVVLFGFVGLAGIASAASATADDTTGGIGITVTIEPAPAAPGDTTPAPVTTTTTTVIGPSGGTGSTVPSTVVSTTPLGNTGGITPTADEYNLGGIVFISGLTSNYNPAVNPLAGTMTIRFTVRNVSDSTVDAGTRFWITGPANNTLGQSRVAVGALASGETRVVTAVVPGVGQWGVIGTHMTFTPPAEVDGIALVPVTRSGYSVATPLYVTSVLVVALGALGALSFMGRVNLFRMRVPACP